MRYSSSDFFGYAALTFTFCLNVRAEGGVGCKDLQGRSYESGFHYIPGPEPCTFCVCDNGNPKWCKAVICKFPEQEDCKSFRRGDTCCEFFCLDDTLSSISNDKADGSGGNVTEGNTNFDIGLRSVASFVTAILSMSLLFFLIHRLRQRKIRGRQSRQLTEEQRNLGNMGYLERGGLQHGVPMDDMPCGGGYPLWKPPGNYFPRGEAPPPYEEAVAAARAEQALLSISPHTLSPLNFQAGFFANSNNPTSVTVVGTAHSVLSPSSPLSTNNNLNGTSNGTNGSASGTASGTANANTIGSALNTTTNTATINSTVNTITSTIASTGNNSSSSSSSINNNNSSSSSNNNNINNSCNNHHHRLSSSSTSININNNNNIHVNSNSSNNNNNNGGSSNAASTSSLTTSSSKPLSSPTAYSGYHQTKQNETSAGASFHVGTSTGTFTIVDTGTYENLPASIEIVAFPHQYPSMSGNAQSFPSSHSTISKNYRQHTTSLPRQNGGAFTISTGASSTVASGGMCATSSISAALHLQNTNVSTHRTIPRTLTSRTGTRVRSVVNNCAPDSEFFHLSPVPTTPDKLARSTRSTIPDKQEEPAKSQTFYKDSTKELPLVAQRSDKQVANSNEAKTCDFKRPLNLANEINEEGSFESVACTCSMQALPTLHDDADDYRSECENCKSATGSRYYLDNEDELITSPHETMTLHRRPEEAGSSTTPQYYRTSLTLPTSTRQRTRSTSVRENWFNTMPQSSTESSDEN